MQDQSIRGQTEAPDSSAYSILWIPAILLMATVGLYSLSLGFHDENYSYQIRFPQSIEHVREMSDFLQHMKNNHLSYVLLLFCYAYIFKQTFAIPGSVFMNLLGGALFGPFRGFLLVCTLTAIGATNCYMLSRTVGKAYVIRYFPDKVKFFQDKIERNRGSLFFFLLSLRLFPMSPNWAMNMIAPIVGVPVKLFFFSVFIGLMPYNYICVQTGSVLSQISSVQDIFTTSMMLTMLLVAAIAMLPGILIEKFKNKED